MPGKTRVTVSQKENLTNTVYARSHELTSDEPSDAGGADAGPTPWELVLAGMGSCTAMTVELYADRKGWSLDGVEVNLERDGGSNKVILSVDIAGDLEPGQRERLESIAVRCPVVKALSGGLAVEKRVNSV